MTSEERVAWFNRRERQILVHSFLYYQMNTSIIPDYQFDQWSHELAEAMQEYPKEFAKSVYCRAFKDFDGSSGFDLPYSMPEIQNAGLRLIKQK